MEAAHLLAFNLALLAAWSVPGPAMLYAIRTALASGRLAAVAAGAGLAVAATFWTLSALLGLDALFSLFPWAYTALKTGGALYLIWIAWSTWRAAREPLGTETPRAARRLWRAARAGALLNLGNPKSMLFAAAVLVVIFPPGLAWYEIATVTLNHLILEIGLYAALGTVVSTPAVSRRYLALKPVADRAAALVMGGLGLRLLIER